MLAESSKLRKRHAPSSNPFNSFSTSRTMMMAQQQVARMPNMDAVMQRAVPVDIDLATVQPRTPTEHYWAARALKAETLLTAQEKHQTEMKRTIFEHELKRQAERTNLSNEHKERHTYLERMLIVLICSVALLVLAVIYLSTQSSSLQKGQSTWWSAMGASHFTIPILSPFASVVENETSVMGAKVIGTVAGILAVLVYFGFRYWLANAPRSNPPGQQPLRAIEQ